MALPLIDGFYELHFTDAGIGYVHVQGARESTWVTKVLDLVVYKDPNDVLYVRSQAEGGVHITLDEVLRRMEGVVATLGDQDGTKKTLPGWRAALPFHGQAFWWAVEPLVVAACFTRLHEKPVSGIYWKAWPHWLPSSRRIGFPQCFRRSAPYSHEAAAAEDSSVPADGGDVEEAVQDDDTITRCLDKPSVSTVGLVWLLSKNA